MNVESRLKIFFFLTWSFLLCFSSASSPFLFTSFFGTSLAFLPFFSFPFSLPFTLLFLLSLSLSLLFHFLVPLTLLIFFSPLLPSLPRSHSYIILVEKIHRPEYCHKGVIAAAMDRKRTYLGKKKHNKGFISEKL